jgi:hypothetical protein
MSSRILLWSVWLVLILGFGWYKSVENQRDDERYAAWQKRINQLQPEGQREYRRMLGRLDEIAASLNARQRVAEDFNDGVELPGHPGEWGEEAVWVHPKYGFALGFTFNGNRMVSHGGGWSSGSIVAVHPAPPRMSYAGPAEAVREIFSRWGGWLWLALLPLIVAPRGWGIIATELLLATALACNVSRLVAPHYSLNMRGIITNDALAVGVILLATSLICLAVRVAPLAVASRWSPRLQFGLRTLLFATAAIATALAMGPIGYVLLAGLMLGGLAFWAVLAALVKIPANNPHWPGWPVSDAPPTAETGAIDEHHR